MINSFISEKAPLIYYSYRQLIVENGRNREIHAANKISIRKHHNFDEDGLEFLIYNCALSKTPELCNGIRQSHIVHDAKRIDFEGKGLSGNGVPLNKQFGCFFTDNGLVQLSTAFNTRKYVCHYLNCFREEHPDIFANDLEQITEFFRSTFTFLKDYNYDSTNTWFLIRACVLSYYKDKYGWNQCPFPFILPEEWENMDKIANTDVKLALLKEFENDLDKRFHDAYQYYKDDDEYMFKKELGGMLNFQGIYYLIYSTLI